MLTLDSFFTFCRRKILREIEYLIFLYTGLLLNNHYKENLDGKEYDAFIFFWYENYFLNYFSYGDILIVPSLYIFVFFSSFEDSFMRLFRSTVDYLLILVNMIQIGFVKTSIMKSEKETWTRHLTWKKTKVLGFSSKRGILLQEVTICRTWSVV